MLAAIGTAMLSVILFHEVNTRPSAAPADAYGSTIRRALVLLTLSLSPARLRLRLVRNMLMAQCGRRGVRPGRTHAPGRPARSATGWWLVE
ncbi:hypothetical protein [Micromonospora sp. B9E7]|uniref:hypothetical protein n=1 Tax=Micromonospora sp. B9E7 TaxID=3153574 RepID=UPI00325C5E14